MRIETRLVGEHWVTSALAAIACGIACGLDLETCTAAAKSVEPSFGRYSCTRGQTEGSMCSTAARLRIGQSAQACSSSPMPELLARQSCSARSRIIQAPVGNATDARPGTLRRSGWLSVAPAKLCQGLTESRTAPPPSQRDSHARHRRWAGARDAARCLRNSPGHPMGPPSSRQARRDRARRAHGPSWRRVWQGRSCRSPLARSESDIQHACGFRVVFAWPRLFAPIAAVLRGVRPLRCLPSSCQSDPSCRTVIWPPS